MRIRILLADDHQMTREGLRSLLEELPDMEVVAEAETGNQTLKLAGEFTPDVVVMDIVMPDLNGMEASLRITSEYPDVKVIGLSMHSERQFVVGMLKSGASGYLLKNCGFQELAEAIRKVHRGGTYITPAISDVVVEEVQKPLKADAGSLTSRLTSREREVLQLIAEAKTSKEIAALLFLSEKTVHSHRKKIMEKLNAKNSSELTRIAIREGISPLE
jgi:two-component system response regulator NreC